jgi:hypothetical protein
MQLLVGSQRYKWKTTEGENAESLYVDMCILGVSMFSKAIYAYEWIVT